MRHGKYEISTTIQPRRQHVAVTTDPPKGVEFWQIRPESTLCGRKGLWLEVVFPGLPPCEMCAEKYEERLQRAPDSYHDSERPDPSSIY